MFVVRTNETIKFRKYPHGNVSYLPEVYGTINEKVTSISYLVGRFLKIVSVIEIKKKEEKDSRMSEK